MVYFLDLLFVYIEGIGVPDSIRKYCIRLQTKKFMEPKVLERTRKHGQSFAGAGRKKYIHALHNRELSNKLLWREKSVKTFFVEELLSQNAQISVRNLS